MADHNQNPLITVPEDEQFISPEGLLNSTSALDWDALLNRGNSNASNTTASKWERDSLYLKFDPLVASRNQVDRSSGVFKAPKPPGPPKSQTSLHQQQNGFPNSEASQVGENMNCTSTNVSFDESYRTAFQDLTVPIIEEDFASPTGTGSADESQTGGDNESEPEECVSQELSLPHEDEDGSHNASGGSVHSLSQEKSKLIFELKDAVTQLTEEYEVQRKQNRELFAKEERELNDLVDEYIKAKSNYEKVVKEKEEMINDRDEALADLRNMEVGFADMLMMYERIKTCQDDIERNCETLKKRETILLDVLEKREKRNEACLHHFETILERLTQDFESKINGRETENAKLKAKLRMCDMKMGTIEGEISQIDRENEKLKTLCDDLTRN